MKIFKEIVCRIVNGRSLKNQQILDQYVREMDAAKAAQLKYEKDHPDWFRNGHEKERAELWRLMMKYSAYVDGYDAVLGNEPQIKSPSAIAVDMYLAQDIKRIDDGEPNREVYIPPCPPRTTSRRSGLFS